MNQAPESQTTNVTPEAAPVSPRAPGKTRLLHLFLTFLGLSREPEPEVEKVILDKGTLLAEERTDLALKRTYWAAERTLLAWIRTAISMISFGFTIGKLGQAITSVEMGGLRGMRTLGVGSIAYLLVTMGTLSLLAAAVQFARRAQELREQGLARRPSLAFGIALLLCLLGAVAFGSLVMKL